MKIKGSYKTHKVQSNGTKGTIIHVLLGILFDSSVSI